MTVNYDKLGRAVAKQYGIVDLSRFYEYREEYPILRFLRQFEAAEDRWRGLYRGLPFSMMAVAAKHQEFLADPRLDSDHPIFSESPILSALPALVVSHSFEELGIHFPENWSIGDGPFPDRYTLPYGQAKLEPDENGNRPPKLKPNMMVEKMAPDYILHTGPALKESKDTLPFLLEMALESSKTLLFKRHPKHWHTVFFTLYILVIVLHQVNTFFTNTFRPFHEKLCSAMKDLAALYLHCCGDIHPLRETVIDMEWLEMIVGTEAFHSWDGAWQKYLQVHKVWLDEREQDERAITAAHFIAHLQNMSLGFFG